VIVRAVRRSSGGESQFIGNFETSGELPGVGDTFWYDTHGPYRVIERMFKYKKGRDDDRPEDVILTVEAIPLGKNPPG